MQKILNVSASGVTSNFIVVLPNNLSECILSFKSESVVIKIQSPPSSSYFIENLSSDILSLFSTSPLQFYPRWWKGELKLYDITSICNLYRHHTITRFSCCRRYFLTQIICAFFLGKSRTCWSTTYGFTPWKDTPWLTWTLTFLVL